MKLQEENGGITETEQEGERGLAGFCRGAAQLIEFCLGLATVGA